MLLSPSTRNVQTMVLGLKVQLYSRQSAAARRGILSGKESNRWLTGKKNANGFGAEDARIPYL